MRGSSATRVSCCTQETQIRLSGCLQGFPRSQSEPAGRARGRAVLWLRRERHSVMPARPASAAATTDWAPSGLLARRPGPVGSRRWCRSLEVFLLSCLLSRDLDSHVFLCVNQVQKWHYKLKKSHVL